MKKLNKVLNDFMWSGMFRFIGIISSFTLNIVFANFLSQDELGLYFLLLSTATFLSLIARFGLKQTVVKIISEEFYKREDSCLVDALIKVFFIVSIGSMIVSLFLFFWFGDFITIKIFKSVTLYSFKNYIIGWMIVLSFLSTISAIFRGLQNIGLGAFYDNSGCTLTLLFFLSFYLLLGIEFHLQDIINLLICIGSIFLIIGIFIIVKKIKNNIGKKHITLKKIIKISSPIFFLNISQYIIANSSIWIVGYYLTKSDVGVYGIILKIFNIIVLPQLIINIAIEPKIAALYSMGKYKNLNNLIRASSSYSFCLTTIIAIVFIVYGKDILRILFSESYVIGYPTLIVLVFGNLINAWTGPCNSFLIMTYGQKEMTLFTILGSSLSIVMSIILINIYGLIGVGIAVAVSVSFQNILAWLYVKKRSNIKTNPSFQFSFYK